MINQPLRLIFAGTPDFACTALNALINKALELARYLERLLLGQKVENSPKSNITMEFLAENGFR